MTHTVLITGCSSGFGLASAKLFLARGWNVVATMRSPDAALFESHSRLLVTAPGLSAQAVAATIETVPMSSDGSNSM